MKWLDTNCSTSQLSLHDCVMCRLEWISEDASSGTDLIQMTK